MKRILARVMTAVLLFSFSASFVYAEEFALPSGNYSEQNYVTREEAVSIFVRAVGMNTSHTGTQILSQFTDAGKIASSYTRDIAAAVNAGMVSGYEDGTFRPRQQITRAEALVILHRILSSRTLVHKVDLIFFDTPLWAEEEINRLAAAGIVQGYGNGYLGASDLLTKTQVTLLAERAARLAGPTGNFYEYANEDWLLTTQIPEGLNAWSDISAIQQDFMKEIGGIVYGLYQKRNKDGVVFPAGSSEQKIVDVFSAGANTVFRDTLGLAPTEKYLTMIDRVQSFDDLLPVMAKLEESGFHGLLPFAVSTDIKDSSQYILSFSECYTGMNPDMAKGNSSAVKNAYQTYITDLFEIYGIKNAPSRAKGVTELCLSLSLAAMPLEAYKDIQKNYHTYTIEELNQLLTNFDIQRFFGELDLKNVDRVAVYDLPLLKKADEVYKQDNLSLLKDYLRASVMDGSALYLNTDAFLIWRDFQNRLNGTESQVMPADYAIQNVEELLGWDLAKLYQEAYPNEEAIATVKEMAEDILDSYKKRIRKNAWLSKEGKASALKKLENLQVRVGYPEDIQEYLDKDYVIKSTKDGGNLLEYRTDYCIRYFASMRELLQKKDATSDRNSWGMLPFTINAMYEPSGNSITIPAGILREPFYNSSASREWNLGSIGSVIAHEISHALDAIGSQFDEMGNLNNWWMAEDEKAFALLCKKVETAYSSIEFLPDTYINGKTTLSENMADIAGMACILDIAGDGNPRLEDLFFGYASIWRLLATDSYYQTILQTDTHAPDSVRVNRVLSNFDDFLDFYKVQPGDGMYLPKTERIQIWNR